VMSASSLATDLVTALGLPGCIGLLHPGQITTGNFFWKAAATNYPNRMSDAKAIPTIVALNVAICRRSRSHSGASA